MTALLWADGWTVNAKRVERTRSARAAAFVNDRGFRVEFLSPNRGSDDHQAGLTPLPSAGGASGLPLRYLDDLIESPDRSVLLHGAGVPVLVPRPERYAVHKVMVSAARRDEAKAREDAEQAGFLFGALSIDRRDDLTEAIGTAAAKGLKWRSQLAKGARRQDGTVAAMIEGTTAGGQ